LGSTQHTILPYIAAISAVQLSLIPLSHLSASAQVPVTYRSETGRWGDERVKIAEVAGWKENEAESVKLVERCERLYQELVVMARVSHRNHSKGIGSLI